ncbi:hypothetical protein, conserved [Babesia bigemina]|uniref:Protein kinase domain-containing protein n=1 Tax=Babesia bigemina TaxID=5866 RepID=A0A061D544_BABBI|nr:hypothetical protein, conserved [Babesia bigemina]CDR95688.1 hypothetical protein, conserved [Babesia bigemina]|eukprot:XP_012767874.1 hypothetical protein, conserved [Babesia bigemina]
MTELLPGNLQAQLDEIHALHYIFYPATVQCRGGIDESLFAEDLMPLAEYEELLSRVTVRSRIELYPEVSEEAAPGSLLKVGFRLSPYTGDNSGDVDIAQSFVEVTFPTDYPAAQPGIVVMMNMSLSPASRQSMVSHLDRVVRDTEDGVCVFNAAMSLNELLGDIHANQYQLWDETTGVALDVDHTQITQATLPLPESVITFAGDRLPPGMAALDAPVEFAETKARIYLNPSDGSDTDSPTTSAPYSRLTLSYNENSTVDREMYASSFDIGGWSLQSLVQSPLWYETGRRTVDDSSNEPSSRYRFQINGASRGDDRNWHPLTRNESLNLVAPTRSQRTWSNENEWQTEGTDVATDKTPIMLSVMPQTPSEIGGAGEPRLYGRGDSAPLDPETMLAVSRSKALLDSLACTNSVERYCEDFTETMTILNNGFSSFVKAQHMLDQNLYMVRTYVLPSYCILDTQRSKFDVNDDIERFSLRRKVLIQQLVSSVALLARLQHNSIARYYQCWVEKVQLFEVISQLMRRAEALLDGRLTFTSVDESDDHLSLRQSTQLLLLNSTRCGDEGVSDFLLSEAVTRRRMYIQMEHCDGTSLDQVIQHDALYQNSQRIWTFTRHLLDVLAYLHSNNAYHQALSLQNIIVYTDASGTGLKVCEFGLARLLREFCYSGFFCQHPQCTCRDYARQLRKELFAYHPSTFGVGPAINFDDLSALQGTSDYDAQQEDMFALGVLIFRMWHPPIEERLFKDVFTNIITTQKFPKYFLHSTPPIIVSTIMRLVSADRRPTAVELLRETLVPPVMDGDLYRQYLRRLQNPLSEEAVDALKFFFRRGWKSDLTMLRTDVPLESLSTLSFLIEGLESFMRRRSIVVGPTSVLYPLAPETKGEASVVVLDDCNTVLSLPRSLVRSLQETLRRAPRNGHNLYLKRFTVGEVFDGSSCKLSAVLSCSLSFDVDMMPYQPSRVTKRSAVQPHVLGLPELRLLAMECDLLRNTVDSLESLGLWSSVVLALHFPPLVIDFLAFVFGTNVEVAHDIYTGISTVDVNQYTLWKLFVQCSGSDAPGKNDEERLERIACLLRRRWPVPVALKRMHALVRDSIRGTASPYERAFRKLDADITRRLPVGYDGTSDGDRVLGSGIGSKSSESLSSDAQEPSGALHQLQEQYLRRMGHMVEMARMLNTLGSLEPFCMEFIPESNVMELCEGAIDFPSFGCYVVSDHSEALAVVGGTVVGESGAVQCYAEYLMQTLWSSLDTKVVNTNHVDSIHPDHLDAVITCQSTRLLPAACSLACRLIDAGISCECRALPLIHTDHFHERLRQTGAVKFRIHLQRTGSASPSSVEPCSITHRSDPALTERSAEDEDNGEVLSEQRNLDPSMSHARGWSRAEAHASGRRSDRSATSPSPDGDSSLEPDSSSRRLMTSASSDNDDERHFTGVSFQVEPLRDCYGQPRKIDSSATLVRYVKSLLAREH